MSTESQKVHDIGSKDLNGGKLCNKSDMEQYIVASGDLYIQSIHKKWNICGYCDVPVTWNDYLSAPEL